MSKKLIIFSVIGLCMAVSALSAQDPADLSETARVPPTVTATMPKLPQDAKPYKNYSELSATDLKGKVKTVVLYEECTRGNNRAVIISGRQHYGPAGDLVKTFRWDAGFTCDPARAKLVGITVWGFRGSDRTEYRHSVATLFSPAERGEFKHSYILDRAHRLLDEKLYAPDGKLAEHTTYKYSDKKIEFKRLITSLSKDPFPYAYFLDDKGNIIKEVDGPSRVHTFLKVDEKGNWLSRNTQVYAPAGNALSSQRFHRVIEYYP